MWTVLNREEFGVRTRAVMVPTLDEAMIKADSYPDGYVVENKTGKVVYVTQDSL